jgi:hypothetical protein
MSHHCALDQRRERISYQPVEPPLALLPFLGVSSLMTARPLCRAFFLAVRPHVPTVAKHTATSRQHRDGTVRPDRFGRHVWEDKTHMTFSKLFATATLAVAALSLAAVAPASAGGYNAHHRHEHKVCKWERHHGHKQKVCRWVHN